MENTHQDESKKTQQQELKHLGFVRTAAIHTIVCLSSLYDYAKQNSGPLKSAVGTVENAVTTVISPVYDKFKSVPDHLLIFLDQKVDIASVKLDALAPPLAKQVAGQVHCAVQKAAELTKGFVHQAQTGGPLAAAHYAANETKELILDQSVKAWSKLDEIAPFHRVAEIAVPTAAHWSEKYNNLVDDLRGKGYGVFGYVPLVPIDEISKAFKQSKDGNENDVASSLTDDNETDRNETDDDNSISY